MTIELVKPQTYAIKRSVMRHVGFNPYDTQPLLTAPVVRRSTGRNEFDANRALVAKAQADYAVYRRTAARLDYRSI